MEQISKRSDDLNSLAWAATILAILICVVGYLCAGLFPVSKRGVYGQDSGFQYQYHAGREHVADLIDSGDGSIRAEVWFDYDLGVRLYKIAGEFHREEPDGWWIEKGAVDGRQK